MDQFRSTIVGGVMICVGLTMCVDSFGRPTGFVKTTILLDAPPGGLAFDGAGNLFALEGASFGSNEATLRKVLPDCTLDESFAVTVIGDDSENFFVGSMTYDPVSQRLLISDNTADGRLYSVDSAGNQQTVASNIAGIAGVAVRDTGEIFVSTSPFGSAGRVWQIDRTSGAATCILGEDAEMCSLEGGLGFGAGLAFDPAGDLIVQDADTTSPYLGRLQRLPIVDGPGGLEFGNPEPILNGMQSQAGVAVDITGDIFTTGNDGLFRLAGAPLAELPFDSNGNPDQFATAIAFDPGSRPFDAFRGPGGGRLAYQADFAFGYEDPFITLLTPARLGDYSGDGQIDDADYSLWRETYSAADALTADGNLDANTSAADYVVWRKFASQGMTTAATQQVVAPEPATWIGAVFATALTIGYRRWRAF